MKVKSYVGNHLPFLGIVTMELYERMVLMGMY